MTGTDDGCVMNDLIFIAVMVVFFLASALYVRACEKL